jgi:hypothetical protein
MSKKTVGVVDPGCTTLITPPCSTMNKRLVPSWALVTYTGVDKPDRNGCSCMVRVCGCWDPVPESEVLARAVFDAELVRATSDRRENSATVLVFISAS